MHALSAGDGLHNVQARDALLKETAAILKTRRAALARGILYQTTFSRG
jgi:hypothetical protein